MAETSGRKPLLTINEVIPDRQVISVMGRELEMYDSKELGLKTTAEIYRLRNVMRDILAMTRGEATEQTAEKIDADCNKILDLGYVDFPQELRSKIGWRGVMDAAGFYLRYFTGGLPAVTGPEPESETPGEATVDQMPTLESELDQLIGEQSSPDSDSGMAAP